MVAKPVTIAPASSLSYLLAKIHMVAKRSPFKLVIFDGYLLAKIHMVAKHRQERFIDAMSYLLAKIHMVAKLLR